MAATITAERLGFTWSCRHVDEQQAGTADVACAASGTDPEAYAAHMKGHGKTQLRPAQRLIKLTAKAPAATLRKTSAPVLEDISWTEHDGEGHTGGEHQTCKRRGQFWAEGPWPHSAWVIPYEPAPWETGRARPVLVRLADSGAEHFASNSPHPEWEAQHAERLARWGVAAELPASAEPAAEPAADTVDVVDMDTENVITVSRQEAAAGMTRYARSLGPGTPACGEYERQAMAMLRNDQEEQVTETKTAREQLAERAARIRQETAPGSPLRDEEDAAQANAVPAAYRQPAATIALRPGTAVATTARQRIDGDQVLRYIFTYLKRFAVWNSDAEIVAAALWIAHTHARDAKHMPIWDYCARLGILGPSGSGKSWKSRLIGKLAYSGDILLEPTKPAFIDLCAENNTIIITEADEAFRSPGRSRGVLAVINGSYEPDRKSSRKQGGVAVKIPLFCHIVLDGIDSVLLNPNRPDLNAMMSRCIVIMATQAPDGYRPPRFSRQARATAELLSQRIGAWMAQESEDDMADDEPEIPEHLGNRPFALWRGLFIVASRADKCWREARRAEGTDVGDDEGPWLAACRDACEELESTGGLPQPEADEDGETELDRQMAMLGAGKDGL